MDLKTIQDWILERHFKAVPGVVDVSGWAAGELTKRVAEVRQLYVDTLASWPGPGSEAHR